MIKVRTVKPKLLDQVRRHATRFRHLSYRTEQAYVHFCQEDFRNIKVLGQGFDKKLVNDEILAKFF